MSPSSSSEAPPPVPSTVEQDNPDLLASKNTTPTAVNITPEVSMDVNTIDLDESMASADKGEEVVKQSNDAKFPIVNFELPPGTVVQVPAAFLQSLLGTMKDLHSDISSLRTENKHFRAQMMSLGTEVRGLTRLAGNNFQLFPKLPIEIRIKICELGCIREDFLFTRSLPKYTLSIPTSSAAEALGLQFSTSVADSTRKLGNHALDVQQVVSVTFEGVTWKPDDQMCLVQTSPTSSLMRTCREARTQALRVHKPFHFTEGDLKDRASIVFLNPFRDTLWIDFSACKLYHLREHLGVLGKGLDIASSTDSSLRQNIRSVAMDHRKWYKYTQFKVDYAGMLYGLKHAGVEEVLLLVGSLEIKPNAILTLPRGTIASLLNSDDMINSQAQRNDDAWFYGGWEQQEKDITASILDFITEHVADRQKELDSGLSLDDLRYGSNRHLLEDLSGWTPMPVVFREVWAGTSESRVFDTES